MSGFDTRERIIAAGLRFLLERGLSASGVALILKSAGVPKGSFYHYFPGGKDEFVLAVVDEYVALTSSARKAVLADTARPPLVRIKAHFDQMSGDFSAQRHQHGCLLGNLAGEAAELSRELRDALQAAFDAWADDLAAVLAEAEKDGDFALPRPAPVLARAMVAGWEGAALIMKSEQSPRALDDFRALWFGPVLPA